MLNHPDWGRVPEHFQQCMQMQDGGVKDSSHGQYMKNYISYLRTMMGLQFSFDELVIFPTPTHHQAIAIAEWGALKDGETNVWNTIRGKLRGIDYINQLAGVHISWSDNPQLSNIIKWCKKKCKSKGNRTALAFLKHHVIYFVKYFIGKGINDTLKLDTKRDKNFAKLFLITLEEIDLSLIHI